MKDIHARKPVDKKAALVVGSGFHFYPNKALGGALYENPPLTAPKPGAVTDLTGIKFAGFIVVGYCGTVRKKSTGNNKRVTHYWSVRCQCGMYSIRTHRAILNKRNSEDACEHCRHLKFIKKRHRRDLGFDTD